MKAIILIVLLFVLLGCASEPTNFESARPEGDLIGFATLSDSSNPADMAASVVYTRLAIYRRLAAKKLRAGAIDVAYAKHAQREADLVRSNLDQALQSGDLTEIKSQAQILGAMIINLEVNQ
jgi:hypothetical protein